MSNMEKIKHLIRRHILRYEFEKPLPFKIIPIFVLI
jgi:hypothetical protein